MAVDKLFHHLPCLSPAAEGAGGRSVETHARDLKADPFLGRLPLVTFIRGIRVNDIDWVARVVHDYTSIPYSLSEVMQRLQLCLSRMARSLDANPLTRLPGNATTLFETTRRTESRKPLALAYLDIDNFSPSMTGTAMHGA